MVNVWDYVNARELMITTTDGDTFIGHLVCVMDAEESCEPEDSIAIEVNSDLIIGFLQSEVKEIIVLK